MKILKLNMASTIGRKRALGTTAAFTAAALALSMALTAQAQQPYGQQDQYRQQQDQSRQQQEQYRQQQDQYRQQQDQYRQQQQQPWDMPPANFSETSQRAFRDGIQAARNDWQAQRVIDARRAQYYRHPPTSRSFRDEYRNSFAQGYQMAVQHRQEEQMRAQNERRDRDGQHDRDRDRNDQQQPYGNQQPR